MRSIFAILLALPVAAQTFVVDANNGPGTNYTSLTAAAAAVPDGAVLLVRAGNYAGFAIAQKGLTVLADPGVGITGTIAIANTNPGQSCTLANLAWPGSGAPCVQLTGDQGLVVLEGLTTAGFPAGGFLGFNYVPLDATGCARLAVRECTFWGHVNLDACDAVFESCTLQGVTNASAFTMLTTSSGLQAQGGNVQLVESTVTGGDGFGTGPIASVAASPGIGVYNGTARVLASTLVGGFDGGGQRAALQGNSIVRIDLLSSPQGGISNFPHSPSFLAMPFVSATSAAPGGNLTATTTTLAGDLVTLVVGLPGAPVPIAGFQDQFWLDPGAHVFLAIGVQQTTAPIAGSIAVPNVPGFRGLPLVWHAACFGPVTGLQNGNPAVALVR
ncbi:MAG: hypothetical protein KDE27_32785 [Planctomycetes bacterium]|nr:hypothetical protein [Planctomycetota bacterium]